MNIEKAYFNLESNKISEVGIKATINDYKGVKAVTISGNSSAFLNDEFGVGIDITIDNVVSWTANYRKCEVWCSPLFGSELDTVPEQTQCLIYQKNDQTFGVILPVVSEKYKCVLCGKDKNTITAKLFSWCGGLKECNALAYVFAEGENPFELLEQCAEKALSILDTGVKNRKERSYPEIFEYIGWCSWDAFQIRVNEEGILEKCEEFKTKNIPVKWAMLDDMWGEVHGFYGKTYKSFGEMIDLMYQSKLYSFEADPIRFPNGLKSCIEKVNNYGITVGMWHPTTGYWKGIDPDGEIYKSMEEYLIEATNGAIVHGWETEKAYRFYNAYHKFLSSCGAKFIKIDNQSVINRFYKGFAPVGEIARNIHDAMENSVSEHFNGAMINCMGTASEDMWNRISSPISRCSGDFMPEDAAWFRTHITQCAFNSLVQGQFYFCDWDMWWTDDGQAVKNSLLRAISGGPVYVSDKIGRSNKDVIMPLILENGKILRCDRPAMPTKDCITTDPRNNKNIFKIQNVCNDSGVIVAFNLDEQGNSVKGKISPMDINGLIGEEFAVYEYFSRELTILKKCEYSEIELKNIDDFKLYIVVPIKDGFAAIGRTDKFISPKTINYVEGKNVVLFEEGEYATVEDGELIFH